MQRAGIFIFLLLSISLSADTLDVCSDCRYTTIQSAIEVANDGDMVRIAAGVYREGNILVNKSIHIQGFDWPILDGENETEILTIIADHVIVEGLVIRNVGTSYMEDRAGIRLQENRFCVIRNNRLYNTFFGIYLEKSHDADIINNEIRGEAEVENASGNGIHCWYSKRLLVKDNTIYRHRDGIYFEFVDNSSVENNRSLENLRYGLHFMFSNDDNYWHNYFSDNGAGVAVMFSKCINMWENTFTNNWGASSYGLLLKELTDTDIQRNQFIENTIGIYVEGSSRIDYHENNFHRNGWALKMSGGCLDNHIQQNNFQNNSFDLSTLASAATSNTFNCNYWSDYSGYDLNYDGIGDVPHRPMKLFSHVVQQTPEAMILLRSMFIDLLNLSEKVSPVLTPANIMDAWPMIRPLEIQLNHD